MELLGQSRVTVDGWEGVELTIGFTSAAQRHHMTALVIVRGAMVHHVTLHSPEHNHWRYAQLARKVFDGTELVTPPDLESHAEVEPVPAGRRTPGSCCCGHGTASPETTFCGELSSLEASNRSSA